MSGLKWKSKMFYALIAVCLATVGMCDVEHAVWAVQSSPVYESTDVCVQEALTYMWHTMPTLDFLKHDVQYIYDIACEMADARGV